MFTRLKNRIANDPLWTLRVERRLGVVLSIFFTIGGVWQIAFGNAAIGLASFALAESHYLRGRLALTLDREDETWEAIDE